MAIEQTLDLVLKVVQAIVNEAKSAQENREALQELASCTEGIKGHAVELVRVHGEYGTSATNMRDILREELNSLYNVLDGVSKLIQKRREKRPLTKFPKDILVGKADKIKAEIDNAKDLVKKAKERLSFALSIQNYGVNLVEDRDLNGLCEKKEWVKVRNYLNFSGDAMDVKQRRLMWKGNYGTRNCLHWACGTDGAPVEVSLVMIGIGGRSLVVAADKYGWTPLHEACQYGASLEIIKALLDVGGTELTLMKSNSGYTALHRLCMYTSCHDDCVGAARALLVKGGRQLLHIKDNTDKKALDLAKEFDAPSDFIDLLTNY